jgi:glutaredoxin 3
MVEVEIYSKAWCPYCRMAKRLLEEKGQEFVEFDVELEPDKYDEMLERSRGRWTVPEIFIDGELIGGFDELRALEAGGQLDELLKGS